MSRFDGHVRELGKLPNEFLESAVSQLRLSVGDWVAHDARFIETHADSRHIILKFPDNYPNRHDPASYTSEWTNWSPSISPIIAYIANQYSYEKYDTAKIILSNLPPGAEIPRHIDGHSSSITPHKIHIPLLSHTDVDFFIEDRNYYFEPGYVYEFNNLLPHSAANRSDQPRIHLIVEIFPTSEADSSLRLT